MEPETEKKYERRYEEGYDVVDKDELYKVWLQFKNLSLNVGSEVAHTLTYDNSASDGSKACTDSTSLRRREVSPALVEVLIYPKPVQKKKQENRLSLPKHLSLNQRSNTWQRNGRRNKMKRMPRRKGRLSVNV